MAYAQSVWLPVNPARMAGAYSRQFQHVFTTLHNQAALAHMPAAAAGIYAERRFLLQATGLYAFAAALPSRSGTFGLSVQQFGYSAFNQRKLGLAYGRPLGRYVSIGLQADYLSLSIQQYGRAGVVTFEGGCLLHITPQLHAGIHVFNPAGLQLEKGGQRDVPVVYTAGAGYEVSDGFLLSAEVIREDMQPLVTRFMCEYRIAARLALQLGLSTDPQQSGAAVSFDVAHLRICLSGSYHPQLGITPGASIVWQQKEALP